MITTAFGVKADVIPAPSKRLLVTQRGHRLLAKTQRIYFKR